MWRDEHFLTLVSRGTLWAAGQKWLANRGCRWPAYKVQDYASLLSALRRVGRDAGNLLGEFEASFSSWVGAKYGLAVCNGATAQCHEFRQSLMADRIGMVLSEALHGGLTSQEIRSIVDSKLLLLNGNVPTISQQQNAVSLPPSNPEAKS